MPTQVGKEAATLEGGLKKLNAAGTDVEAMKITLAEAKKVVSVKQKEVKVLMDDIAQRTTRAEAKAAIAKDKEESLALETEVVKKKGAEASNALLEAMPALEAAAAALDSLKKEEITELRQFNKPHKAVRFTLEAVCCLKNVPNPSWPAAKTMMADTQFLNSLINFDKGSLNDKMVRATVQYIKQLKHEKIVEPSDISKISTACVGMLTWVNAIVKYHGVEKGIAPLRNMVRSMEQQMKNGIKELAQTKKEVAELNDMLGGLRASFEKATAEKNELEEKAATMERQLGAASKLITGLAGEKIRWTADVKHLKASLIKLVGDTLVGAAFLSYQGAFTFDYRADMMKNVWVTAVVEAEVPLTDDFNLQARHSPRPLFLILILLARVVVEPIAVSIAVSGRLVWSSRAKVSHFCLSSLRAGAAH